MLYLIHRGHIGWKGGESEVLHLVTRVSRIGTSGCVFTDTNAATSYHQAHTNLALLSSIIDWSAMPLIDWSAAKAARQAEFLVPRFVPWYTFDRIIVRSNSIAQTVNAALRSNANRPLVTIDRAWYYS